MLDQIQGLLLTAEHFGEEEKKDEGDTKDEEQEEKEKQKEDFDTTHSSPLDPRHRHQEKNQPPLLPFHPELYPVIPFPSSTEKKIFPTQYRITNGGFESISPRILR